MAEGRIVGEPVHRATELMLRDVLHFTQAPLESNRTRDYRVVELRLTSFEEGRTVVEETSGEKFRYTLTDKDLKELGAELVYARMGTVS